MENVFQKKKKTLPRLFPNSTSSEILPGGGGTTGKNFPGAVKGSPALSRGERAARAPGSSSAASRRPAPLLGIRRARGAQSLARGLVVAPSRRHRETCVTPSQRIGNGAGVAVQRHASLRFRAAPRCNLQPARHAGSPRHARFPSRVRTLMAVAYQSSTMYSC